MIEIIPGMRNRILHKEIQSRKLKRMQPIMWQNDDLAQESMIWKACTEHLVDIDENNSACVRGRRKYCQVADQRRKWPWIEKLELLQEQRWRWMPIWLPTTTGFSWGSDMWDVLNADSSDRFASFFCRITVVTMKKSMPVGRWRCFCQRHGDAKLKNYWQDDEKWTGEACLLADIWKQEVPKK